MKQIFFGPPASGKGTAASRVAPLKNVPHISTGDLFRYNIKESTPIGIKAQEYIKEGKLVPDEIVIEMLKQRLEEQDTQNGFILDGFPRTVAQAEMLKNLIDIDAVINLVVPEEILIERSATRRSCTKCGQGYNTRGIPPKQEGICDECGGSLERRKDDDPEVMKKRLEIYKQETFPLIDFYKNLGVLHNVITESIEETPQQLVDKVMKITESK